MTREEFGNPLNFPTNGTQATAPAFLSCHSTGRRSQRPMPPHPKDLFCSLKSVSYSEIFPCTSLTSCALVVIFFTAEKRSKIQRAQRDVENFFENNKLLIHLQPVKRSDSIKNSSNENHSCRCRRSRCNLCR